MAQTVDSKLMGCALTYARRYGLFTIMGIAGEDNLGRTWAQDNDQTSGPAQLLQPLRAVPGSLDSASGTCCEAA